MLRIGPELQPGAGQLIVPNSAATVPPTKGEMSLSRFRAYKIAGTAMLGLRSVGRGNYREQRVNGVICW
jgi:hypothetical protein